MEAVVLGHRECIKLALDILLPPTRVASRNLDT